MQPGGCRDARPSPDPHPLRNSVRHHLHAPERGFRLMPRPRIPCGDCGALCTFGSQRCWTCWKASKGNPLERHTVVDESTGCWEWQGAHTRDGYGMLRIENRAISSHRYSYTTLVGPIPEGLEIDHLCRNRNCCNPEHLEPVTRSENLRRSPLMGRARLSMTHCKRGHPYNEANTRYTTEGHRQCRECENACRRVGFDGWT